MLRFVPDGWLEGVLRPLVLIDPSSMVHFETAAPDWRFAAFLLLGGVALLARRRAPAGAAGLAPGTARLVLAMGVMFYVWTFISGNGRYFAAGMLLIGPLLVLAWRHLPGTRAFRAVVLAGVVGLQCFAMSQTYTPNRWGLARWVEGPGLGVEASPLRTQPAVFLTITGISHSLLVPAFHPESRWANVAGQRDITPLMPEHARLRALLASGLPTYVIAPLNPRFLAAGGQPDEAMQELIVQTLTPHGLGPGAVGCSVLRSSLQMGPPPDPARPPLPQGYWVCPVQPLPGGPQAAAPAPGGGHEAAAVFDAIEQRCPRFFPPGGGTEKRLSGHTMRHYPGSDVRLYVDDDGGVSYRYFQALNETRIGTAEQVLRGTFEIDCGKLPGRYRLPWLQD